VSGNHAYVADDYSGIQIINVSDPANPSLKQVVKRWTMPMTSMFLVIIPMWPTNPVASK
jgi:hypothetical protein